MAQSERIFRDLLCEGRAHPVETTDPTGAKTIDELKKQVAKVKGELEFERQNSRQQQRDHEKELRRVREEHEKRLDATLDAVGVRKEMEKVAEVKRTEERLLRLKDQELKLLAKDKNEEMRQLQRKLEREKEESVRFSVEIERRKYTEEILQMIPEGECASRETKLAREVFMLGEQNEHLEEQARSLLRENRTQIDLMRRMKHEHEAEIGSLLKKNQVEASRDMAQLRLAERIISEKEHDLHVVEYRADMTLLEKEAIAEELAHVRSVQTVSSSSLEGAPSLSSSLSRPHVGGGHGGLLQKRVEELDMLVKKLDEERSELKQENAQLRKRRVHEGDAEAKGSGKLQTDDKLKKLRKRNADLVALAKQLDDKFKALKQDNEHLQKQASSLSSGDTEARRALSRQHAKDIVEYTRQLHAKDRDIDGLKKKLAKLERSSPARQEPSPELEKRVKGMAMEALRMESVIAKLYAKIPDVTVVEPVLRKELETESRLKQELVEENRTLKRQLEQLQGRPRREEVDFTPAAEVEQQVSVQGSMEQAVGRAEALKKENVELGEENARLKAKAKDLSQFELECQALKNSLGDLQLAKLASERQLRQLNSQLEEARVVIGEMERAQDQCSELEREVEEMRGQLNSKDTEICQLELECQNATSSLSEREQETETLRHQVLDLESMVSEKEQQYHQLVASLEDLRRKTTPPERADVCLQTDVVPLSETKPQALSKSEGTAMNAVQSARQHPTMASENRVKSDSMVTATTGRKFIRERVKSPIHRDTRLRMNSPKSFPTGDVESNLEYEMRAAGVELTDEYDSSECPGFSDEGTFTNLDDTLHDQSSLVSVESGEIRHERMSSLDEDSHRFSLGEGREEQGGSGTAMSAEEQDQQGTAEPAHHPDEKPSQDTAPTTIAVETREESGSTTDTAPTTIAVETREESGSTTDTAPTTIAVETREESGSTTDTAPTTIAVETREESGSTTDTAPTTIAVETREESGSTTDTAPTTIAVETREESGSTTDTAPITIAVETREESGSTTDTAPTTIAVETREESGSTTQEHTSTGDLPPEESHTEMRGELIETATKEWEREEGGERKLEMVVGAEVSLEELATEDSSSTDVTTSSSESDLPGPKNTGALVVFPDSTPEKREPGETVGPGEEGGAPVEGGGAPPSPSKVSIFIAKYSYRPAEMSPNPNYEQELTLTAGDYLYVFGDMDEDGFYQGQLMSGVVGLVPSNFIEKVADENEEPALRPPRRGLTRRRLSDLQDIIEESEDTSSSGSIPPPQRLELEKQFVDKGDYSVVLQWGLPHPLPPETTGYNVYVNGELRMNVEGAQQNNVLLSGVPRLQLVKISVRTATEEGESPDPQKLIVLNPQYLEPPINVRFSESNSSRGILVQWTPGQTTTEGGTPVTGYAVYINEQKCIQLDASDTPCENVCAEVLSEDLKHMKFVQRQATSLTVCAISGQYESAHSTAVHIAQELLDRVLQSTRGEGVVPVPEESESSLSSEDSPAKRPEGAPPGLTQPASHVNNGTTFLEMLADDGNGDNMKAAPLHYYRALYSYNPLFHSPNDEEAGEELTFEEGDIIVMKGTIDEDGFFQGQLCGREGLVPSNMVEEVAEEELAQIHTLLQAQAERKGNEVPSINGGRSPSPLSPGHEVTRRVRALYDYSPAKDSPNIGAEEELHFTEGDIISVFGRRDKEGFFLGELRGKRGMVPGNFVGELFAEECEVFAADEESTKQAEKIFQNASDSLRRSESPGRATSPKRKNILSKGKDLLSKSLGKRSDSK